MATSTKAHLVSFEGMLTRFVVLGNIMVVSSSVRSNPYRDLLETCYDSAMFTRHMESVLVAVSDRMGLTNLSQLFESYASQIVLSTCLDQKDFAHIPSHLLGYKSPRGGTEESLKLVGPTLLLAGALSKSVLNDTERFESLCDSIGMTKLEGLRNCLHDVIGLSIVLHHADRVEHEHKRGFGEYTPIRHPRPSDPTLRKEHVLHR